MQPQPQPLTFNLANFPRDIDVLIIGSGAAGVAVAEHLYRQSGNLTIGILERGGILTTTHVSNVPFDRSSQRGSVLNQREAFITAHGNFLWEGAFKSHGLMIYALGGRGIVAGAHLRRFDPEDFTRWDKGRWPLSAEDLNKYYTEAEVRRHVRPGDCDGGAQSWVLSQLHSFNATAPPWGVDSPTVRNLHAGRGYDSSIGRLWGLILEDYGASANEGKDRRLFVATHSYVTKIEVSGNSVRRLFCVDSSRAASRPSHLKAQMFVLAASPIESARLFLYSDLEKGRPAAGHYLAEHLYYRKEISVRVPEVVGDIHGLAVRVVVPPTSRDLNDRFQIEIVGEEDPEKLGQGYLKLRLTGEAAMDPQSVNMVSLSDNRDSYGVPYAKIFFQTSGYDETRITVMKRKMTEVTRQLGFEPPDDRIFQESIGYLGAGRSHHEAGTLRMGAGASDEYVTHQNGQVQGVDNLYVADASVFPCVGVANPMLTITALAYRLAEHITAEISYRM